MAMGAKVTLFAVLALAAIAASSAQNLTHISFYMHDIIVGDNPTAVRVAQAATTNTSATSFGAVSVIDDLLTVGPNSTTETVGRAQGMYFLSEQSEYSLSMSFNIYFTNAQYNGSTIAIQGKNAFLNEVREMAIVGGTGVFRFAKGYTEVRTYSLDPATFNGVLQYDLYFRIY